MPDSRWPESLTPRRLTQLLFFAVVLLYLPAAGFDFAWDDKFLISENPYIKQLELLPQVLLDDYFRYTRKTDGFGYYRPLARLSFYLEYQLWGVWAGGYHLLNLLIHLANGYLVVRIARRLLPGAPAWGPLLAAAVFLIIPVNIEAVAWISGRPELLASLGVLGAVALEERASTSRGARAGQALLLFLGLCAKEVAVVTPALLWVYSSTRQLEMPGALPPVTGRYLAARAMPIVAVLAAYFGLRYVALGPTLGAAPLSLEDLLRDLATLGFYAGRLVLPLNLSVNPRLPRLDEGVGAAVALGTVLVSGFAGLVGASLLRPRAFEGPRGRMWMRVRNDLFWMAIPLAPAALVVPRVQEMPDRYLYLPTIGLGLLAARLTVWPPPAAPRLRYLPALYLVALVGLNAARLPAWRNDLSLWADVMAKDPKNSLAVLNYGVALRGSAERAQVAAYYRQAIEIESRYPRFEGVKAIASFNLGNLAREEGKLDEALEWYRQTLRLNEHDFVAMTNVGVTLLSAGRLQEAETVFRKSLEIAPEWIPALVGLGAALGRQSRLEEARSVFEHVLELDPDHKEARANLARVEMLQSAPRTPAASP